jgi:HD-GYP domain-containing protein (c-di-GMP phosphodiesterase class II)
MADGKRLGAQLVSYGNNHYLPVHVGSIRSGSITGFDLYFQPGPEQPLVLYAERHIPFTEEKRQRLWENRVATLYVDIIQEDHYQRYIERNLPQILADPAISVSEKTQILYASAQGVVKDVLETPEDSRSFARSREIVAASARFVFNESAAFQDFVRVTSYNYYTYTHSVNVCVFGLALAVQAGHQDEDQLRDFGNGLLLHDIGKCRIDPAILNSTGKLTNDQWIKLKQHPIHGEEIVAKIPGIGPIATDVVRHHHEKLDGSGYPDKLRSAKISPWVRMATIVDIFDAITTNRSFQPAVSTFDALRVMRRELAAALDQELFRLFIQMLREPDETPTA